MGEHKCPISKIALDALVKHLIEDRDLHQRLFDEYGHGIDEGYVNAYRDTLSALHIFTNGEYGQSRDEQSGGAS